MSALTPQQEGELEILTIQGIMNNKECRTLFMRILNQAGTYDDTFNPDPHHHAHNTGRRSTGVWISKLLKDAAPDDYFKMLKEYEDND